MLYLTPSQREILKYIKEGRYRSVRTCAADLGLAPKTVQAAISLLKAHGKVREGASLVLK